MPTEIYDLPEYYDIVFARDTQLEATFIQAAWKEFGGGGKPRVLEPACGSGRLVVELCQRGYDLTGFDLNETSLRYLRDRLASKGLSAEVVTGNMIEFDLGCRFDLAYCTLNTFRHLCCEADARSHLQNVADHLRPGGLYILAFHLLPPHADEKCVERLRAQENGVCVDFELRVQNFSRRARKEQIRLSLDIDSPGGQIRGRSEFPLRIYRADQFMRLLKSVPDFDLVETFDFDFDIDCPRDIDNDLADAVFVLQKEG